MIKPKPRSGRVTVQTLPSSTWSSGSRTWHEKCHTSRASSTVWNVSSEACKNPFIYHTEFSMSTRFLHKMDVKKNILRCCCYIHIVDTWSHLCTHCTRKHPNLAYILNMSKMSTCRRWTRSDSDATSSLALFSALASIAFSFSNTATWTISLRFRKLISLNSLLHISDCTSSECPFQKATQNSLVA